MCEFSPADGFVELNENLGDMIKYVANEPSVGLYYIQQHAQNAVPNVVKLKNNTREISHEVSLHTEDLEDSLAMTRSMKECGFPIIDEIIRDLQSSLTLISGKQPVRGMSQQRSSSYLGGPSSWMPGTWARSGISAQNDNEKERGYFSNVFKTAKEKAGNLKWSQFDLKEESDTMEAEKNYADTQKLVHEDEVDELPVSSPVEDEGGDGGDLQNDEKPKLVSSLSNDYDEFKAEKEAKLEEWLKGSNGGQDREAGDSESCYKLDSL